MNTFVLGLLILCLWVRAWQILLIHLLYPQLGSSMQFRLDEINKIKNYLIAYIRERETMCKALSKYIAAFD